MALRFAQNFKRDYVRHLTTCADKTGERFFHIASWWWVVILGFIISLSTNNTGARYVSMFFMAFGYVGECFVSTDDKIFK
jgi:hypothetical protein